MALASRFCANKADRIGRSSSIWRICGFRNENDLLLSFFTFCFKKRILSLYKCEKRGYDTAINQTVEEEIKQKNVS